MRMLTTYLAAALILLPGAARGQGSAPASQPLWSGPAPGALGQGPEDRPSFTFHPAPDSLANGAAVVVFPGGGYGRLALDHEGAQVARWLNSIGVTAMVVTYRLGPKYRHPVMLHDAQRAIRTARARAAEWRIDPRRIGILGFSAGGHLASTAGTHFDAGLATGDRIDRVSSRPDFMLLAYPVITMDTAFTHRGSRNNLLGPSPDPALERLLSNEKQVTASTPPTFLVHTTDDAGVPVENSVEFFRALRAHKVPAEMHLYRSGRHGLGLGGDNPAFATWPRLAEAWMRGLNLLAPAAGSPPAR